MKDRILYILIFFCLCISAYPSLNIADFNGDKKVDLKDFAVFAGAWGTHQGQGAYNPECDIFDPPNQVIDANDLRIFFENWNTRTITLDIYSNGWGYYCDTVLLPEEGNWLIEYTDPRDPYGLDTTHYAYAQRDRYYTELYRLYGTDITPDFPPGSEYVYEAMVDIDLDPIDPNLFNGTIFLTQTFFTDAYLSNQTVQVLAIDQSEPLLEFTTDSQGRFAIDLLPDLYWIQFYENPSDPSTLHGHYFQVSGYYSDYSYPATYQAFKPNIYIYPDITTELTVQVNFPEGGTLLASEPLYEDGWQVTVEPSGLIDGQYHYLFYESKQPDFGRYEAGWVVQQEQLETFFRENLAVTGFNANEIADFIDYWIPLLDYSPYYAVYPQYNDQIEKMIHLDMSVEPDNLIRLIYSIRGIPNNSLILPEPQIPNFCRDGFTVAEWGVILK